MKKIYRFIVIIVLSLMTMTSKAQNDGMTLTLLPHFSYNNFYNPGVPVESKFVFGAGVSNVNLAVFNSSINYNNLFSLAESGSLILDANKFINSLDEHNNVINSNLTMDVLRMGLTFGRLFVDFGCRMKFNGELQYSKDFLGFFVNGNGNYLGKDNPANLSIGANISLYTELSLGLQYQLSNKFSIGVRPKILVGMANLSATTDGTRIYTDENLYGMTADVNFNIQAASLLNMENINSITDAVTYFNNMDTIIIENIFDFQKNIGYGLDFGFSYNINKHIGFAAGVYDLGYITWNNTKVKQGRKDNMLINDAIFDSYDDVLNMELDFGEVYESLIDDVWGNDSLISGVEYKTSLKTRLMLQGHFELCSLLKITAIGQMYCVNEEMYPALTLAYSGSIWRLLNFTASYTRSEYAGNSIGAGIGVNVGPLNAYIITDNIMIASKYNAPLTEMLTSYSNANIRLGVVFTLGKRFKKHTI